MAFPLSPANNQTALVNGIVYQWNSSLGVWKRNGSINAATIGQLLLNSAQTSTSNNSGTLIVAGGAGISGNLYTGGIYITGSANGITFPDGTVQTTAGVAVDSFARSTANSASSNTVIIQGVDTAQNTRMSIIEGVDVTQNTRITIAEGVDVGQNTRMSIIEGVDTTQNTNITIATNAATAAFAQANATAGGLTSANTRLTIIEGVDTAQNTRISIIEGVDLTQNSNITIIQGVDLTQNTNITNADVKAQAAFDKANDAYTLANTANTVASSGGADSFARQTANAAFTQANTATTLAQAAFNKANTSDAVLTSTVDTFAGNGSTTAFTLSVTPATINYTTAVVGGVTQPRSAYSVVGTTLTFTSAPANNQIIEVTTIGTSNTTLYTVNNIISPFLLMGA